MTRHQAIRNCSLWDRLASRARPATRAQTGESDEAGAILVLALVFLVAVSVIVVALLSWVGTSLSSSASFSSERSLENAATSAVNLAIQESRGTYAPQMLNISPPVPCWYTGSGNPPTVPQQPPAINSYTMDVWCSMVWQPFSPNTRVVTYSACQSTVTAANCAQDPLLQAVVTFDDYTVGIIDSTPSSTPVPCSETQTCGQSLTQNSWQWSPTVPVVSSISPTTNTIVGGVALTITGTGFVPGSSVNFVQESADAPTSANVVITVPASQVTVGGCDATGANCTTLSLTTPSVTSGTDYFVTVTTPGGTSAYLPTGAGPNLDDLQYTTSYQPTVTSISGPNESAGVPQGSITGGSTITINGTGFYNNTLNFAAQVWFCQLSCNTAATKAQASNVDVLSSTQITAASPAVTTAGTWYVQVRTVGGVSANTSDNFNYGVQVPLIISLSPSSGGPNTQLVLTGSNFLTGSQVTLYLDQNGAASGNAISTSETVTSPTSITVTIPTTGLTVNSSYFPVVTLPAANGSLASQPYNEPSDIFKYT